MYSIGIIAAQQSLHHIMRIDHEMRQYCNITYLPYSSVEHLQFLYQQNIDRFDAFLFSGFFPYQVVLGKSGSIPKPHAFFNISDRDYYRLIARLAVQKPGLDFSRVYFDKPEIPVDFSAIFDSPNVPLLGSLPLEASAADLSQDYMPTLDYYHKLWESGTIDLIVTRFSSMEKYLTALDIRHEFLFTSPESMLETFRGLLMRLSAEAVNDAATAIGLVTSSGAALTKAQCKTLSNHLQSCNKQFGMVFLVYEHGDRFELTTNIAVLKDLSQQYTICPITAYLQEVLDFPVYVGWGCANNAVDAHRNAQRAIKEARQCNGPSSFIVTADNVIIGPLSSVRRITYADSPNEELTSLSNQLSLSPLYISKILSVLKKKGSNTLSSEELAFFLNITTRSASRILNKLEEGGIATVQYNRQLNLRGRPAKIYKIHFGNLQTP